MFQHHVHPDDLVLAQNVFGLMQAFDRFCGWGVEGNPDALYATHGQLGFIEYINPLQEFRRQASVVFREIVRREPHFNVEEPLYQAFITTANSAYRSRPWYRLDLSAGEYAVREIKRAVKRWLLRVLENNPGSICAGVLAVVIGFSSGEPFGINMSHMSSYHNRAGCLEPHPSPWGAPPSAEELASYAPLMGRYNEYSPVAMLYGRYQLRRAWIRLIVLLQQSLEADEAY